MPKLGADWLGAARLAIEAVNGVTELVEAVHMNVLEKAIGTPLVRPVAGVTALVYRGVKGVTRLVGGGLDAVLARLAPALGEGSGWAGRAPLLAAVNGVLGDHLARSGNPLAIPLSLRRAAAPGARILVLAHGLCMNDEQWLRDGVDHGVTLARDCGYTPVYLHYNSGRHVSENGRAFALALQEMIDGWPVPVERIALLGHSMGGLVARSACQFGGAWLDKLSALVTLGTPHHGAPLERGGNWVHLITELSAYSAPFSRLAKIRSAGITDLRFGSVLDEDWRGKDRFAHGATTAQLPLPARVRCYALAATLGKTAGDLADTLAGDGLVPLASALGQHADAARRLHFDDHAVVCELNHMDLLSSADVERHLIDWLK
ncbi:MAG: alpha/beta hydrolase [Pseudomonadota bacterium]